MTMKIESNQNSILKEEENIKNSSHSASSKQVDKMSSRKRSAKRQEKQEEEKINSRSSSKLHAKINQEAPVRKRKVRKHKMTEFSYLLQRKCFRMMRRYFKDSFEYHSK